MNKHPADVIKKFKQFELGEIGISTITVSELQYGVAKSTYREKNEVRIEEFLAPFEILTYDLSAAKIYGDFSSVVESNPTDVILVMTRCKTQKMNCYEYSC